MKNLTTSLALLILFVCFNACKPDQPTPVESNLPENCVLTKVTQSDGGYDEYSFDSQKLLLGIKSYFNGKLDGEVKNTYDTEGKIISQILFFGRAVYTYNGTVLTRVQILDTSNLLMGELIPTFDANGRFSTITVQKTNKDFRIYEGVTSTYSYDNAGNCTKIDISNAGIVIQRVEYSNFVPVISHFTKYKGLYFDPMAYSPAIFLTNAQPLKFPNTSFQNIKSYSALDQNGKYTGKLVLESDETITRKGNISGMIVERASSFGGKPTVFEYTGCN